MNDDPRPDDPRPDDALPDAAPRDDEPQAAQGEDARQPSPLRRVPWSPWWRPAVAAAAVGALTWGATTSGAAFRTDGATRDAAATTASPGEAAFVQAALLACPGTVPWLDDDAGSRPAVEVMAAAAPRSVLEATPPRGGEDAAGTAVPDGAASTGTPDAADDDSGTAGPSSAADSAATTAAPPDGASSTAGPAAATSGGEEPDEGASVLRGTDGPEGPLELEHGIPEGLSLEQAASALVHASGQTAPGVVGGQVGLGARPGSRGLTVAGCVPPAETQWLVGGGAAPGRSEQLVLSNPGPDAVTVEVSVWGAEGPVTTTGASGIVVPGGGRTVELLDGLAPAVDAPVLAVSATGGPVVAHLAESYREGTTDRGTEVVSPVAAPATDLVVPALPSAPEGHDRQVVLRIAAPGDAQAVVDLTALTEDGAERLADRVTRVPAGHTLDVELGDLPAGATALRLRSDQPVTAGARLEVLPAEGDPEIVDAPAPADTDGGEAGADVTGEEPGDGEAGDEEDVEGAGDVDQGEPLLRAAGDVAWVGATVPVATPSGIALPDRSAVPDAGASLALTAVDGTTAWVTWVDGQGGETSRSVPLPHDTTTLLTVPEDARAVWVVGAGPAGVAASLHLTGGDDRGPLVASTTLPGLPWLRQVTEVRPLVP